MSNKNSIKKGKIKKDCYSLDMSWYLWLKERLPVFLHDADKHINLEFEPHKREYDGKLYTIKSAVEEMIYLVNYLTSPEVDDWETEYYEKSERLCDLWKIFHKGLWW